MYLIDLYILCIFFIFLCLILLIPIGYVLYMNEQLSPELSNEAAYKTMARSPLLLSDWVYLNLDQDLPYLDENRHLRTVGKGERLRFIMDRYDSTGAVVNSAVRGIRQATLDIEGQQVCGTLIYKRGGMVYGSNNRVKCKVNIPRILALRETHELTTKDSPLEVVVNYAYVSPSTGP